MQKSSDSSIGAKKAQWDKEKIYSNRNVQLYIVPVWSMTRRASSLLQLSLSWFDYFHHIHRIVHQEDSDVLPVFPKFSCQTKAVSCHIRIVS